MWSLALLPQVTTKERKKPKEPSYVLEEKPPVNKSINDVGLDLVGDALLADSAESIGIYPVSPKRKDCFEYEAMTTEGIFSGWQVVLDLPSFIPLKWKQCIRKKLVDSGATVSYIITKESKLVISWESKDGATFKQKAAAKSGIPAVTESYIDDCLAQNAVLSPEPYLISQKLRKNAFLRGRIQVGSADSLRTKQHVQVNLSTVPVVPYKDLTGYEFLKAIVLRKHKQVLTRKDLSVSLSEDTRNKPDLSPFNYDGTSYFVIELHAWQDTHRVIIPEAKYCVFTQSLKDPNHSDTVTGMPGICKCYFVNTPEVALGIYSQLFHQMTGPPNFMAPCRDICPPGLGTPTFQLLLSEWSSSVPVIDPAVAFLTDTIWTESVEYLKEHLEVSPESIPIWKVEEAEGILHQISLALSHDPSVPILGRLSREFYQILPHKKDYQLPITSHSILSEKQDICQVLHDMVCVSEASSWAPGGQLQTKYKSLRCHVKHLTTADHEFSKVKELVLTSQTRNTEIDVHNVYKVSRDIETIEFAQHIQHRRTLFHSTSPSNLVGILSRGLLVPRTTESTDGERSDASMLGCGIYFADDSSLVCKYSKIGKTRNTRFLLICEVALENVCDTWQMNPSLVKPPDGFDSMHGVKSTDQQPSDFVEDEYVIFKTSQQCLNYLVELSLPEDGLVKLSPWDATPLYHMQDKDRKPQHSSNDPTYSYAVDDIGIKIVPKTNVTPGLQELTSCGPVQIPLKEVHVRAKLLDLVAKVVVLQVYKNCSAQEVEAKYVFPLESGAAVCGFEAFINDKHVVGKVKEKETAHKEYHDAVSKGHGAYLMDQDASDVFTVSVGNLPPGATVCIKITYILELAIEQSALKFSIPSAVAPWQQAKSIETQTQDVSRVVGVTEHDGIVTVQVGINMPFPIKYISCHTHKIVLKRTECMAVVKTEPGSNLENGFMLLVSLAEVHVPRMLIEHHPHTDSQASMLTFYPEFESQKIDHPEIILITDASNSMKGQAFQDALYVTLLCLQHLTADFFFNVIAFGTVCIELFPQSKPASPAFLNEARDFLKQLTPSLGNTEIYRPLRSLQRLSVTGRMVNVFIISDGHVSNVGATLHAASAYCRNVRIFTMGVSSTANKYFLRKLAHHGAGAFEYFDTTRKSLWRDKVATQVKHSTQPVLSNVRVQWQLFEDESAVLQAPAHIMSLFSGQRQVVYGFVPNCSVATLFAEVDGQEISTVVSATDLEMAADTMLHSLAARAIISDWEDGLLADSYAGHLAKKKIMEKDIVELSKEYSIVTSLTSFVAVEERETKQERRRDQSRERSRSVDRDDVHSKAHLQTLLDNEAVDFLSYMEYPNFDGIPSHEGDPNDANYLQREEIMIKTRRKLCKRAVDPPIRPEESVISQAKKSPLTLTSTHSKVPFGGQPTQAARSQSGNSYGTDSRARKLNELAECASELSFGGSQFNARRQQGGGIAPAPKPLQPMSAEMEDTEISDEIFSFSREFFPRLQGGGYAIQPEAQGLSEQARPIAQPFGGRPIARTSYFGFPNESVPRQPQQGGGFRFLPNTGEGAPQSKTLPQNTAFAFGVAPGQPTHFGAPSAVSNAPAVSETNTAFGGRPIARPSYFGFSNESVPRQQQQGGGFTFLPNTGEGAPQSKTLPQNTGFAFGAAPGLSTHFGAPSATSNASTSFGAQPTNFGVSSQSFTRHQGGGFTFSPKTVSPNIGFGGEVVREQSAPIEESSKFSDTVTTFAAQPADQPINFSFRGAQVSNAVTSSPSAKFGTSGPSTRLAKMDMSSLIQPCSRISFETQMVPRSYHPNSSQRITLHADLFASTLSARVGAADLPSGDTSNLETASVPPPQPMRTCSKEADSESNLESCLAMGLFEETGEEWRTVTRRSRRKLKKHSYRSANMDVSRSDHEQMSEKSADRDEHENFIEESGDAFMSADGLMDDSRDSSDSSDDDYILDHTVVERSRSPSDTSSTGSSSSHIEMKDDAVERSRSPSDTSSTGSSSSLIEMKGKHSIDDYLALFEICQRPNNYTSISDTVRRQVLLVGNIEAVLAWMSGGFPLFTAVIQSLRDMASSNPDLAAFMSGANPSYFSSEEWRRHFFSEEHTEYHDLFDSWENGGPLEISSCIEGGIISEDVIQTLRDRGLNSLGSKAAEEILHMVATTSAILYIVIASSRDFEFLDSECKELGLPSNLDSFKRFARHIAEQFLQNHVPSFLILRMMSLLTMENRHPLVYHTLGLGHSWEAFVFKHLLFP